MPLRELVAVALTLFFTVPLVPLAILARSRPHLQGALRAAVPLVAIFVASRAFFGAFFGYRVAIVATSGESVDVMQRESVLRDAVLDSRPLVVLGAIVVVLAFAWAIAAHESRRARVTLVAGGLALVAALAWIGTRDARLHDRLARTSSRASSIPRSEPRSPVVRPVHPRRELARSLSGVVNDRHLARTTAWR